MTLVMACVVTVGWVRSWSGIDSWSFAVGHRSYCRIDSWGSSLSCDRYLDVDLEDIRLGWIRRDFRRLIVDTQGLTEPIDSDDSRRWKWKYWGIFAPSRDNSSTTIPYWSIVIPLGLVSAWLLISKTKKTQRPTVSAGE